MMKSNNELGVSDEYTKEISIVWQTQDIQDRWAYNNDEPAENCPLTAQQLGAILVAMEKNHDANEGINWFTVDYWLDNVERLTL